MPCIDCGLAVNADGTGRVDIDTEGGLTCVGGAGGTSNTAGTGLAIDIDPATGNSASTSATGLFVPGPYTFDTEIDNYEGGAVADPDYPNSSFASPVASITLDNSSGFSNRVYIVQASLIFGQADLSTGSWVYLNMSVDGGLWFTAASSRFEPDTGLVDVLTGTPVEVGVPAGNTVTVEARMRLYIGNIDEYAVNLHAWGGYPNVPTP